MELYQQHKYALGSDCFLTLGTKSKDDSEAIFEELWDSIDRFEDRFSRFKTTSELTNFNQRAGKKTAATQSFIKLAKASREMSIKTGGIYNPFVLPALQSLGYSGSWPNTKTIQPGTDYRKGQIVTIENLEIGDDWLKIPSNTALDFGGCGKGYMLDQLAKHLAARNVDNYWLSLGGDIICSGHSSHGEPWEIAIQEAIQDTNTANTIGSFYNTNDSLMAIATSGTTKRKGDDWHHIIDPRTGLPAETNILTASVRCDSAIEADVMAKCLVIVGLSDWETFAKQQQIEELIIQSNSTVDNIIKWGNK